MKALRFGAGFLVKKNVENDSGAKAFKAMKKTGWKIESVFENKYYIIAPEKEFRKIKKEAGRFVAEQWAAGISGGAR